jgi:hypothetical protein
MTVSEDGRVTRPVAVAAARQLGGLVVEQLDQVEQKGRGQ